jgi:hypothetical protein
MKLNVISPCLMAMDNYFYQGGSSFNPNYVCLPLEVVESVITFFSIQLLTASKILNLCAIILIDGNG